MNTSQIVKLLQSSSKHFQTENPASLNRKYMKHNFSDYKRFGENNETQWRLQRIYVQFTCLRAPASNCEEDECGGAIELLFLFTSNITAEETLIEYCQLSSWDPTQQPPNEQSRKHFLVQCLVSVGC